MYGLTLEERRIRFKIGENSFCFDLSTAILHCFYSISSSSQILCMLYHFTSSIKNIWNDVRYGIYYMRTHASNIYIFKFGSSFVSEMAMPKDFPITYYLFPVILNQDTKNVLINQWRDHGWISRYSSNWSNFLNYIKALSFIPLVYYSVLSKYLQ